MWNEHTVHLVRGHKRPGTAQLAWAATRHQSAQARGPLNSDEGFSLFAAAWACICQPLLSSDQDTRPSQTAQARATRSTPTPPDEAGQSCCATLPQHVPPTCPLGTAAAGRRLGNYRGGRTKGNPSEWSPEHSRLVRLLSTSDCGPGLVHIKRIDYETRSWLLHMENGVWLWFSNCVPRHPAPSSQGALPDTVNLTQGHLLDAIQTTTLKLFELLNKLH